MRWPVFLVGLHDPADQIVPHDMLMAKLDVANAFDVLQQVDRLTKARSLARRQIDLRRIASPGHPCSAASQGKRYGADTAAG